MDVDTTNQSASALLTSRAPATDPRLNRLTRFPNTPQPNQPSPTPDPNSTSALSVQQDAASASSSNVPEASGAHFHEKAQDASGNLGYIVPQLVHLMDSRAALVSRKHEKAVLDQEDAVLRKNISRAQALSGSFPSTVETLQSMRDNPSIAMQKLDLDLKKQQAICSSMADGLRTMLQGASHTECEKAAKVEAKLREELKAELKEELADVKKGLQVELRKTMEAEKKRLWDSLREQIQAEIEEVQPASPPEGAMSSADSKKLGQIEASLNFVSKSNSKFNTAILNIETWINEVKEGRTRLPSQAVAPDESNTSRTQSELAQDLAQLKEISEAVSRMQRDLSDHTNSLSQQAQDLAALKQLPGTVNQIQHDPSDRVNSVSQQAQELKGASEAQLNTFLALKRRVEECQQKQNTTNVAIRSLEYRYQNINSEGLVKSMVNAMQEMYPNMQKHVSQLSSLQAQFDSNKDELTKKIDSLKSSLDNVGSASIATALQDFKRITEQFAQLQETQRLQADDIVRHLEEVKDLRNGLEGYSQALALLGDQHSDLSEGLKALEPRFGEFDSRLEGQAKQCKDSLESFQGLQTQLEQIQAVTSENNLKKICEEAQQEKLGPMWSRMEEFNLHGQVVLEKIKTVTDRGIGSLGQGQKPLQTPTNGLVSGTADTNGTPSMPQDTTPRRLPDGSQEPTERPRVNTNPPSENASQVPTAPRAMPQSPSTASPGATGGSFRIRDAASQHESERGRSGSASQPAPQESSKATPSAQSPNKATPRGWNVTTGRDLWPPSSAPVKEAAPHLAVQAHAGKKRMRETTLSEEGSVNGDRRTPASNIPSSESDRPLKKSNKGKKKEKEKWRQSQLQ